MSEKAESHHSRSASRDRSFSENGSRHGSESPRHSPSRSRSRSKKRSHRQRKSRSKSRSRSYKRYSRSRSNSRRRFSRSRSRSYDRRRSSRYNQSDDRNPGSSRRGYYRSRSRSPFSSRRRHLGDRENPQASRCLGIFGLSLYTQERDIRDMFEKYGPVDEVQVVYDHQTGRSRGFAFVYMRNSDDAMEAKEMAAGKEIDGRKIRVDFSITKRAHTPTPGVYLGKPTPGGGGSSRRSRSPQHGSRRRSRSLSRSYSR